MKIFISYSHKDRDEVMNIVKVLKDNKHSVWIDSDEIKAGNKWNERIEQGINESDVVVVFVTHNFVESKNCIFELGIITDKARKLLPIIIGNVVIPINLKSGIYRKYNDFVPTVKPDKICFHFCLKTDKTAGEMPTVNRFRLIFC